MKIERTKNAIRNIFFGIFLKLYQIIVPFIIRTVMIHYMGVQYLGLSSLFASILDVLNLAELGIGSAMVYSMYKPIVEENVTEICALMNLYKKYYRIIGLIIASLGICIIPFLKNLIVGSIPDDINIYILYLINLSATVLSYWLFAYKNSLILAYQRNDISSKVSIVMFTLQYIFQIISICIYKNYYIYLSITLITQIISNIVTAIIVDKMFPNYKARGKLDKSIKSKINRRIKDLFTAKIGGVIVNSADTIVISAFLGLSTLAIYQNYYYIIIALITSISLILNSCKAGIGNSIIVETKEKNYIDLKKFTFIINWISGICICCLIGLYQPFMKIWVGESLMLDYSAVVCLCIYFYLYVINQLLSLYKDAAGIWHKDRFRPLVTALCNLIMNIIMVNFLGIYGVMLSTILSMFIVEMPWLISNIFIEMFDKKYIIKYVKIILYYAFITVILGIITYFITKNINLGNISTIGVRLIVCVLISNILYFVIYKNYMEFSYIQELLKKVINRKKGANI